MNMNHHNLVGSSSTNPFPNRNIHVLLVEDESRDHDNIMNLLNYFSYKVTSVKLVSTALSILSKGKVEFDLVMANMNSQESLVQLLQDATKMKLLVIFMSNVDDDVTSMGVLEEGAFLCIRKPLSMAIVASLWQLVMSDKAKETPPAAFTNSIEYHNNSQKDKKLEFENYNVLESNKNTALNLEKKVDKSENYRSRYKRKAWTEWTLELHQKFMAAARFLGQGKCYPKDILEIMNEPGLTRLQVASHLQKCRNANWLPPNERKSKAAPGNGETIPKKVRPIPRAKTIRFGLMPFWEEEYSEFHQTIHEYHHAINLQTEATTHHVFGHDDHAQSSNSRYLDHGLHPFGPDDSCHLDHGLHPFGPDVDINLFFYGDFQSQDHVDPLTNFLPNLINEDPFESLGIMDPSMVPVHDLPDFQKELDQMDFDQDWESFLLDGEEQHHQVSAVAAANNQWFDETFNSSMENEETTEQGQAREGR